MNEKQQEFFNLCKNPNVKKDELIIFYHTNNKFHIFNQSLANLCLIACCENDNMEQMLWIYITFIISGPEKEKLFHCKYVRLTMQRYIFVLCCEIGNVNCLQKLTQKMKTCKLKINELKTCYDIALQNNYIEILLMLSKWFSYNIFVFPNFHHHYDFYFFDNFARNKNICFMKKKQKQRKQLFLLWLTSSNSPNTNCLLYQLPRDISKYIIEQFVD
jgi:hypothetical protein